MGCQHSSHPAPSSPVSDEGTEVERGEDENRAGGVICYVANCIVYFYSEDDTPNSLFSALLCCSLKLECEKLATEKTEIQRHYVMVRRLVPKPDAVPSRRNRFQLFAT